MAAKAVAEEAEREARDVPYWTQMFKCRLVKDSLTLEQRQQLAGRMQARESNVREMTMAQRVGWLYRELEEQRERWLQRHRDEDGEEPAVTAAIYDKGHALRQTFIKTGVSDPTKDAMVCSMQCPIAHCQCLGWCLRCTLLLEDVFRSGTVVIAQLRIPSNLTCFVSSQKRFVKEMAPVADWVIHAGKDVLEAMVLMQRRGSGKEEKKIAVGALRCLEALYHPDDFKALAFSMKDESLNQNPARLRAETLKLVRQRHWTWVLLHPGLTQQYIHPERSMFASTHAVCVWDAFRTFGGLERQTSSAVTLECSIAHCFCYDTRHTLCSQSRWRRYRPWRPPCGGVMT